MKSFIFGIVTTLILGALVWYTNFATTFDISTLPTYSISYDKTADPHKNLTLALIKAKKEDKKIFLLVGGDWCKWCGSFDNFLYDNPGIQKKFYTSFEVVRVYYGKGINEATKRLLIQFPALKGTPHFYILSNTNKLLKSQDTSKLERGFGYDRYLIDKFLDDNK